MAVAILGTLAGFAWLTVANGHTWPVALAVVLTLCCIDEIVQDAARQAQKRPSGGEPS